MGFQLTIVIPVILLAVACSGSNRNKRQLMFPPESIMQLAFAVITPGEVKGTMLTTNLGVMFNINLPTNISTWYPWRPDYRRRRSTEDIHFRLFSLIENLLTMSGLDGKECLKKSFCQMRESPIPDHDLPHQLLTLVFGNNQEHTRMFFDLHQTNNSCETQYSGCTYTPVDLFFDLYFSTFSRSY